MSEINTFPSTRPYKANPIASFITSYPLTAYFIFAFAGTWLTFAPAVLSKGFQLFTLPDPVVMILHFLATLTGPMAAAVLVTSVKDGRAGVRRLLKRIVQFKVGAVWYLAALVGYPLLYLAGLIPVTGLSPFSGAAGNLPAAVLAYLPALLFGLLMPSLGEETGWRGFALPRLERLHGPLLGTLILGSLHAVWHLPAYLVPGYMLPGGFEMAPFLLNSGAILAASFLWTWLNNHAKGSIFYAMLVHSASNASPAFVVALLGPIQPPAWLSLALFGTAALALIVLTRGKLGYQPEQSR